MSLVGWCWGLQGQGGSVVDVIGLGRWRPNVARNTCASPPVDPVAMRDFNDARLELR